MIITIPDGKNNSHPTEPLEPDGGTRRRGLLRTAAFRSGFVEARHKGAIIAHCFFFAIFLDQLFRRPVMP
jgi:hypothetical protein